MPPTDREVRLTALKRLALATREPMTAEAYGVYLDGVAVLPVEWWDSKWINDNIVPKLEGRSGEEIAQAQQPSRAKKARATPEKPRAAGKRRR